MKQLLVLCFVALLPVLVTAQKPRLLITTDIGGDPDDQQSLVRLMLYTNEFDIEGLISSAAGTPGELNEEVIHPELIEEIIRGYGLVYPNLIKHDKGFAPPGHLLAVVKKGNPYRGWDHVGNGNDTEGSEWIIRMADKKDKRPLNICIFGGQTDLAQALWKVKNTRSEKAYHKFISKIRVFDIDDQDKIFEQMFAEHPSLFYILSKAPLGQDKRRGAYRGIYLGGDESLTSLQWLKNNVLENHGPLGQLYPQKTWTEPNPHGAMKEGDTPSWFYFLENGLNYPACPGYGGWGGRYHKNNAGYFSDAASRFEDETDARATVYRWRDDFQRDFSARMDWCVNDYQSANHPPVVSVNGHSKKTPLLIRSKPGEMAYFDASASGDPDNDQLRYEWILYPQAGDFHGPLPQINTKEAKTSIPVPELEPGVSLHLILKVTDSGVPALTGYKRIIITNRKGYSP